MVCIYHNADLDGFTSAAIVKRKYPNVQLIGWDYGMEVPFEEIQSGEPIIMVDISFEMKDMLYLANHSHMQLTWIDHHVSAIDKYREFIKGGSEFLTPVLKVGRAACELTWEYLFPNEVMPDAVHLIGTYDVWRAVDSPWWEEEVMPFQYGMRSICNSARTFPINLLEGTTSIEVRDIVLRGKGILNYIEKNNERVASKNAFELEFKGLRTICMNSSEFSSKAFESVYDSDKHDLMMNFQYTGDFWKFSLYTTKDDVDCSELARAMGGGGHKKAAGFEVESLEELAKIVTL